MENSLLHGAYDERKCVLAVCEQNNPRMIKIHPVFFLQSQ